MHISLLTYSAVNSNLGHYLICALSFSKTQQVIRCENNLLEVQALNLSSLLYQSPDYQNSIGKFEVGGKIR